MPNRIFILFSLIKVLYYLDLQTLKTLNAGMALMTLQCTGLNFNSLQDLPHFGTVVLQTSVMF